MAFRIHTADDGHIPGTEYLPCGAMTPKAGAALKFSDGYLAQAGASDEPAYICLLEKEEACEAGDIIPVMRIAPGMTFETDTPEGFSALPGEKVQLAPDGSGIAAAAGGACEVIYTDESVTRVRLA